MTVSVGDMGPDLQIDWIAVCRNPADFEKLVKLLLVRLHPRGQVLDGAGGDGGREFQVRTADRLEVYEAKSFIGRVARRNPNRRAQVERSLKSAGRLQPDAWHLVVPIDHNPDELTWFDSLRACDYDFVDQWHGQIWLEAELARHPDLVRYATQDRLLEYVKQYRIETDALVGGIPKLLERVAALDRLADEVDPYWRPTFGRLPDGGLYGTVVAKSPDAAEKAPITLNMSIEVPTTPEHEQLRSALRAAMELGTGAVVPGEFVTQFRLAGPPGLGLPDNGRPDLVELIAEPNTDVASLPTQTIAVYAPDAAVPLASLTFHPRAGTSGLAGGGAQLTAFDPAGVVKLVTGVYPDRIRINLQSQNAASVTPAALLPSLRLALALHPPNRLELVVGRDDVRFSESIDITVPFLKQAPEEGVIEFVEGLALVQDTLRQAFPVPDPVTVEDALNTSLLRRLLAGERVRWKRGPITVDVVPEFVDEFRAQYVTTSPHPIQIAYSNVRFTLGGHTIDAGPMCLQGPAILNSDSVIVGDDGESATAAFDIVGDGWMYMRTGLPDDPPSDIAARGGQPAAQTDERDTNTGSVSE